MKIICEINGISLKLYAGPSILQTTFKRTCIIYIYPEFSASKITSFLTPDNCGISSGADIKLSLKSGSNY
ncbi:unnamed protein product [Moneuplotes crassus]|uniref:Uncharacterized protein n=1 Tax=Euplotes crassus TaxID=5936 RepID=A0AAD1X502_EUPCR|nr:unnamed protein product [Moneuplotes crassus]